MLEPLVIAIVGMCALLLGLVLGWLAGRHGTNDGAETVASLRLSLDGVIVEREEARIKLAQAETALSEREQSFEEQLSTLAAAKESLSGQFAEISQKLLHDAQTAFLQRASERFDQAGEKNEEKIKLLLSPVGDKLKAYEEQVGRIEKERSLAYGDLKGLIGEMKQGQERVTTEAARIVNSLRSAPKASGRWGEQQFENLLEIAGLKSGIDYRKEVSVANADGIFRPDFIINLPGDQTLIVDIKCPLDAYLAAVDEVETEARLAYMKKHANAVSGHVQSLASKAYWNQFDKAPDYVVLYIPGDNFLSAALEHDLDLWERAARNRVIVSGPATFFPLAKTIAGMWRQKKLSDEARQIGALGKEMYDRLAVAAEHLKKVGSSLGRTVGQYNDFVGSFERNVLSTGRKFADLNIETGKRDLEDLPEIEALPRYNEETVNRQIDDQSEVTA